MGTLIYCDADDCRNTDHNYDNGIFDIHDEVNQKFNLGTEHLCKSCLDLFLRDGDIAVSEVVIDEDFGEVELIEKGKQ
jgi:hypothetical protein